MTRRLVLLLLVALAAVLWRRNEIGDALIRQGIAMRRQARQSRRRRPVAGSGHWVDEPGGGW